MVLFYAGASERESEPGMIAVVHSSGIPGPRDG